ncbi:hypothetical protein J2S00_000814 [Caldalkalibacillus uzonensis]|uniref:Uncharacterized protein n=1 Tax=Caldalkalibacillus uzonensis TaxID=353224 RepID=A0ABU0CNN3_9BACI|nr:hypothetical protein [Caldalkalibacillus uzonensis]
MMKLDNGALIGLVIAVVCVSIFVFCKLTFVIPIQFRCNDITVATKPMRAEVVKRITVLLLKI